MQQFSLAEAQAHLSDLIAAAMRGEKVFITTDDQARVQLVPVAQPKRQPQFGSAKGLITYMADDFDAPLPDFDEDTVGSAQWEKARREFFESMRQAAEQANLSP